MNVRTKTVGSAVVLAVIALVFAYPVFAAGLPFSGAASPNSSTPGAAANTTSTANTSIIPPPPVLSVGQTVTFTSTNGQWRVIDPSSKPHVGSGPASGTVTFTVTGAFKGGYALSITSGTLSINGTTYTIASGSAELGPYLAHVVGQGSLSPSGSFLVDGNAHANFFGDTYNTLRFDLQANGVEYGVLLLVNVVHS
jgi:hypothetical protein